MGVYSGIAQENLLVDGGTLSGCTVQLVTVTAAQLGAIGHVVNTVGKVAGTLVFETTNNRLMIATGANPNSTWVRADGTNAVTPA